MTPPQADEVLKSIIKARGCKPSGQDVALDILPSQNTIREHSAISNKLSVYDFHPDNFISSILRL